jgi:hypothetical protein
MNFKLVDKKNMGGIALLLLIIILSQSRFFNFLIDTALGRAFLIAFIIFISCCHKIMGVVGVLLIIIMFNGSKFGILEGFDAGDIKAQIEAKIDACGNDTTPSTPPLSTSTPSTNLAALQTKVEAAKEGFDLIGTESRLKSGKQSNSISVNHKTKNIDNVLPSEENVFSTSSYSKFN